MARVISRRAPTIYCRSMLTGCRTSRLTIPPFSSRATYVRMNLALCALQTLFMREHNFWADEISAGDPTLDDDGIYLRARAIIGAEIELITYRDFIPILLGPNAIPAYTGFNRNSDPRVALAFATAANRMGHSLLPPLLL